MEQALKVNLTDPDSRIVKTCGGWVQRYHPTLTDPRTLQGMVFGKFKRLHDAWPRIPRTWDS